MKSRSSYVDHLHKIGTREAQIEFNNLKAGEDGWWFDVLTKERSRREHARIFISDEQAEAYQRERNWGTRFNRSVDEYDPFNDA